MTYTHESYLGWRGRNYGAEKVQFKNRIVATGNVTAHHDHILLHTLSLKYRTSFAKSKTRHIDTIISQNKSNNLASVTKSLEI